MADENTRYWRSALPKTDNKREDDTNSSRATLLVHMIELCKTNSSSHMCRKKDKVEKSCQEQSEISSLHTKKKTIEIWLGNLYEYDQSIRKSSRIWGPASPAKLRSALLFGWLVDLEKTGEIGETAARFRWLLRRSSEQNIVLYFSFYFICIFSLYCFSFLFLSKRQFTEYLARSS